MPARPGGGVVGERLVAAERPDQAVQLVGRVARGRTRSPRSAGAGPLGVAVELQAAGAGLDRDHVDGVADRVVQVAGDARALLGAGQPALAARARRGGPRRPRAGGVARCRRTAPPPTARPDSTSDWKSAAALGQVEVAEHLDADGGAERGQPDQPAAGPGAGVVGGGGEQQPRACDRGQHGAGGRQDRGERRGQDDAQQRVSPPQRRGDGDGDDQGERCGHAGAVGRHEHDRDAAQRDQHRDQADVADAASRRRPAGRAGRSGHTGRECRRGARFKSTPSTPTGVPQGHHRRGARRRVTDRTLEP